jgi:hypothetical protein
MKYQFNRDWLVHKFSEIQSRMLFVLQQLNDEDVNWRPNNYSNSISNLIMHIEGNIKERIEKGILQTSITRNREEELGAIIVPNGQLQKLISERFNFIKSTIESISDQQLETTQLVRGNERTNLDMLHQCAAHYSEHLGQVLYIAKIRLEKKYISTTHPIKPIKENE